MALLVKPIFLEEKEKDIFLSLENQGIDTKVFENKLADLFNKVYNNYVGYYIFKQNNIVYKLIVLPKSIDKNSKTKEKDFVNYLLHYLRVKSKYKDEYKDDATKEISDSLLSLAFKNNNDEKNSHPPLEEFEFYKYKSILESIDRFFKKHKNYKRIKVDYSSQSVKYKLNLQNNIKELDKTTLHQTRTVDMMYSLISTITYNSLKLFMTNKLNDFDDENKKILLSQCKNINSSIAKKYNLDKGYKLTLLKLNSFKIEKVFKSTNETKKLLISIKSLFGFEQMYDDTYTSVNNRYDLSTTSFFIDPILFYEWYVYDILKSYADNNGKIILFDKCTKKENKTTTKYKLISNEKLISKDSKPDFVLVDEKEKIKIIIDAKWKNIDSVGKIHSSDYLKLQFDTALLKKDGFSASSYLVYPSISIDDKHLKIVTDDKLYFNFNILQIDMNFNKNNNSIDFIYDYEEIEKQIIEETKIEKSKISAENLSTEILEQRTNIVTELLNQNNLGNKEKILSKLDTILINSADKLSEDIKEIISEDIKIILEKYDDVLEDDSKKFLKSSSSIYNYYKDRDYEHFDYSMPGSGLWKLIELELNTSFSWFIRIQGDVCDKTSAWKNISNPRRSITQDLDNGKKVKLNQYEHNNKNTLQGLMLGGISLLLNDASTLEEFKDIESIDINYLEKELIPFVSEIINLRNEHAHIKAMKLEKYQMLDSLLFDVSTDMSNICKLLNFKKVVLESINY